MQTAEQRPRHVFQFNLPNHAAMGRFIGKGGQKKTELETHLKTVSQSNGLLIESLCINIETTQQQGRNCVRLQISCTSAVEPLKALLANHVKAKLMESCSIQETDLIMEYKSEIIEQSVSIPVPAAPEFSAAQGISNVSPGAIPDLYTSSNVINRVVDELNGNTDKEKLQKVIKSADLQDIGARICEELGIRKAEEIGLISETTLKEYFMSILSWLKPIQQIKVLKFCEYMRKDAAEDSDGEESTHENECEEGNMLPSAVPETNILRQRTRQQLPVVTERGSEQESDDLVIESLNQWRPFRDGPLIQTQLQQANHAGTDASARLLILLTSSPDGSAAGQVETLRRPGLTPSLEIRVTAPPALFKLYSRNPVVTTAHSRVGNGTTEITSPLLILLDLAELIRRAFRSVRENMSMDRVDVIAVTVLPLPPWPAAFAEMTIEGEKLNLAVASVVVKEAIIFCQEQATTALDKADTAMPAYSGAGGRPGMVMLTDGDSARLAALRAALATEYRLAAGRARFAPATHATLPPGAAADPDAEMDDGSSDRATSVLGTPLAVGQAGPAPQYQVPASGVAATGPAGGRSKLAPRMPSGPRFGQGTYDATAGFRADEAAGYKAAGALFVRVNAGRIEVLLCVERRIGEGQVLSVLGGQREPSDRGPLYTAVREFTEETSKLLPRDAVHTALSPAVPAGDVDYRAHCEQATARRLWVGCGRYVLYVTSADKRSDRGEDGDRGIGGLQKKLKTLCEQYEEMYYRPVSAEADHLTWVPWNRITTAASALAGAGARKYSPGRATALKVRIGRGAGRITVPLSDFLRKLSAQQQVASAITAAASSTILDAGLHRARLQVEADFVHKVLALSPADFSQHVLGQGWELRLAAPPLPDCSSVRDLRPTDPEYKDMARRLPADWVGRITGIRQVRVAVRRAEFEETRKSLTQAGGGGGAAGGAAGQIKDAVFHGTPERWRATAIALNGFSTTTVLHGRALGDGVYTSEDPSVCVGYAGTAGSILWLRGIVTADTRSQPPVYVFRDRKQVLPLIIADIAAANGQEQQMQAQAEEERKKAEAEAEAEKREFAAREQRFRADTARRWRDAAAFYLLRINALLARVDGLGAASPAAGGRLLSQPGSGEVSPKEGTDDDSEVWADLLLDIDREMAQFQARLPIYADKERILKTLKDHQVVILTAATGSGKSTQVPQYLLDEVLRDEVRDGQGAAQPRRIAVLQPRRVNAVSLAARVAGERAAGGEVGGEIGFRLGRGDVTASEDTRIEYMTHGLFVQMAQDPARLIRQYCAVVLDEAHERSVDVDISLGLLRRALEAHASAASSTSDDATAGADCKGGRDRRGSGREVDGRRVFKVVVMSATIPAAQVKQLMEHLNPTGQLSAAALDVPGSTFPVRILYRGDLQPDKAVIGTKGVGEVMGDYAMELALDLLQRTPAGHILVFMPGEAHIERAMQGAALLMRKKLQQGGGIKKKSKDWWQGLGSFFGGGHDGDDGDGADEPMEPRGRGFAVKIYLNDPEAEEAKDGLGRAAGGESGKSGSKSKKTAVRVGFYPFHGKLPAAERDQVLRPRDERMVVFATNVAETGLTIPDVRYVIDTGLERRVRFDPASGVSEMVTAPISQSSMDQRAGRAGRVASGVCIRLYTEEDAKSRPEATSPEIEESPGLSAALRLVAVGDRVILPDPVDPDMLKAAAGSLLALGAVDEKGAVTEEVGVPLLRLGLDIRLGRFLLACARAGCVEHGVRLAAVIATDAHQRLLPPRPFPGRAADQAAQARRDALGPMLDPSGDHVTLIRIVIGFEAAARKIEWCRARFLDYQSLVETGRTKAYILEVLAQMQIGLRNEEDLLRQAGGWVTAVLRSLCAAYCDQVAVVKKPGDCRQGFVRMQGDTAKANAVATIQKFAEKNSGSTGPANLGINPGVLQKAPQVGATNQIPLAVKLTAFLNALKEAKALNSADTANEDHADNADSSADAATPEIQVSLRGASFLWLLERLKMSTSNAAGGYDDQKDSRGQKLVVFSSVMLTDAQPTRPQVSLVSFVTPKDVQEGAPSWCQEAGFGRLYKQNVRHIREFPVPPGGGAAILAECGAWLVRLRHKFPSIWVTYDKNASCLRCSAPAGIMPLIEARLEKLQEHYAKETVVIDVPDRADMAKFIGPRGANKNALEEELKKLAKDAGVDPRGLRLVVETVPKDPKNAVKLEVQGDAKAIVGVLIGRIQTSLVETCRLSLPELRLDSTSAAAQWLQCNPRVMQLATSVSPAATMAAGGLRTRDDIMLLLAHAVVWKCGCCVYGGFVRDWVVRGQQAVDIDALLPSGKSINEMAATLKAAAAAHGIQYTSERQKGAAYTVTFASGGGGGAPIDVDLVDPKTVPNTPPGVDADVDNIMLDWQGRLALKVPTAANQTLPLAKCVKHAKAGKFVFFYDLSAGGDTATRRLGKLLSKGFRCVSPVPDCVLNSLPPAQRSLVQPKSKYSFQWWAGAK